MRLAVLVHTPTAPSARASIDELRPLLQRPELGFWVVEAAASDDLALGLPRALEGTPAGSTLLVVAMGEVQRGPAGSVEVVGTTRSVRVEELRAALVTAAPGEALLVIDGVGAGDEGGELSAATVRAVAPGTSGVGVVVGLHGAASEGPSPLLGALAAAIEAELSAGVTGPVEAATLLDRLADRRELPDNVRVVAPARGFVLLRPPPRPFGDAPSADATFAEAESLLAQGQLEGALEACKRVLLLVGNDRERRAEVYVHIAAIKQRQGKGREAGFNLDKALAIDPHHRTALEGQVLLAANEARWDDVGTLGDRLLAVLGDDEARVQTLVGLAGVFPADDERTAGWLERARALRPSDERVLERLAGFYDRARRYDELVSVLESWAEVTDNSYQRAARLAAAGRVARRGLGDMARAIRLFDQALRLRRDDAAVALEMAEALEHEEHPAPALKITQLAVVAEPRRADAHRGIVRLASRTSRPTLAAFGAMALVHLEQADLDDELLADQHRPEGPIAARRPLAPAAWDGALAPSAPPAVAAVLAALEPIAIAARTDELREAQRLPQLDPQSRQDPQTSTLSAVRAFGFAGRLLGVTLPDLYLLPEVPGGVAAVAAERATTVLGKSLLSGRTPVELTFLMARHLAYHRPGARLALYYPSLADLMALLHAAVQLGRPGVSVSSPHAAAAGRLYTQLSPRLDDATRAALVRALDELDQAGRRPDVTLWLRRLELTATRAGLLACGDLNVAARLVEHDPAPVGDLSPRAKADDLLAFAVSDAHEALRREILS